jgi:arylsulfatase A-like enzyme
MSTATSTGAALHVLGAVLALGSTLLVLPALVLACASPPGASPSKPNILLVSMDTVRFDRTSLAGGRPTTPNLAALAEAGSSWTRAYAVGNESIYSHAALMTGRYPSEVALPDYGSYAIPTDVPTLATVLGAYGYHTAAFTGGGHVIADFGFGQGFNVFRTATGDTQLGSLFDSVPSALAWIGEQGDAPWFAFVHGYDVHSPYVQRGPFRHLWGSVADAGRMDAIAADPVAVEQLRGQEWFPDRAPQDFLHAAGPRILGLSVYTLPAAPRPNERVITLTDGEVEHLRDHYDSGLSYADVWLGQLLAGVDLDHTLVVVISDHGEDLLDHGFVNHRAGLWDSSLHVPLVVAGPGFMGGGEKSGMVDLRSVVPTVLRAVGALAPAGVVAPALQDDPSASVVYAEGVMDAVTVRDAAHRLILSDARLAAGAPDLGTRALDTPEGSLNAGLYAEPGAENRLGRDGLTDPGSLTEANALRAALLEIRAQLRPASVTGAPVSPALRDALRARGYWTPGEPLGGAASDR